MTTHSPATPERRAARRAPARRWWPLAVPLLAALAALAWSLRPGGATEAAADALYAVEPGDLRISVVATGNLKATRSVDIHSELEGQNTVLYIIPEGTNVKQGELLAELDATNLVERRTQQLITFEKARAAHIEAKESFEIQKNQCESNIKAAELRVEFADTDLRKYLEGDHPQAVEEANARITLAEEELKRAKDKRDWSARLAEKGYVTRTELEADDLQVKKRTIDLDLARQDKDLLLKYSHPKEEKKLTSDLEEARKELERVRRKSNAELARAEANLKAQQATYELEESRLLKLEDQIGKAKVYAPGPGLVVYATTSRGRFDRDERPIEEGATVRERQLMISLPDVSSMTALTKIHESALSKVRPGMSATVTIDAMPDRRFSATVSRVSVLPDSQSSWLNPDLKVYTAEVLLRGDTTMLKPGLSCSVEILAGELRGILQAPLQVVHPRGKRSFCYVEESGRPSVREIEVGESNARMVHVKAGLSEGERVYLYVPKGAPVLPKPEEPEAPPIEAEAFEARSPGGPPDGPGGPAGGPALDPGMGPAPPEGGPERGRRRRGGGGMGNLSAEERERMRERFRNMSEEERRRWSDEMRARRGGGGAEGQAPAEAPQPPDR